jgi:predicted DCC family thiol-disulfide oxidoreductase YuxK
VNTEITVTKAEHGSVVLYDDACAFCTRWARRLRPSLHRAGLSLAPLGPDRTEMRVHFADGRTLGGADAVVALSRRIWWLLPLWLLSLIPGTLPILRIGYRFIARHRHCLGGTCEVPKRNSWLDWMPLAVLPALAFFARNVLPNWQFMWLLAAAIFFSCKWLTWRRARSNVNQRSVLRTLGYWLAWPGMDATEFLDRNSDEKPPGQVWLLAISKTTVGIALLWFAVTNSATLPPITVGWFGMIAIVLNLHFGMFHLLALFWQANRVAAMPLMRVPLLATSLNDFWSMRWNTAFNKIAHDLAFRPLARRFGIAGATLGTFLISGVIHDLVISLPARAGFGLPTAYFALQGAGVLFERSKFGRKLGLHHGTRGWLFMFVVTAAPAYWLFHPPFIRNVILPMLQAFGAT